MLEQYQGRKLSTDEAALAKQALAEAEKELEGISFTTGEDYLLLKWGTWKEWDVKSEKAKEIMKKYREFGSSMSGMSQHDTPEQKALLCELIDEVDGTICSDWTGEYFTKQQAKDYIMDYGNDK